MYELHIETTLSIYVIPHKLSMASSNKALEVKVIELKDSKI